MGPERVRNEIRRQRFEHGEMTQQELADRVGCSRQTIVLLEQERYGPSLALAMKLARVFGVGVEDLFRLEEDASPGPQDPAEPVPEARSTSRIQPGVSLRNASSMGSRRK